MISLDTSPTNRHRFWIDEPLPALARFQAEAELDGSQLRATNHTVTPRRLAIETLLATGPQVNYALLGGEFAADLSDTFGLTVGYTASEGPQITSNLLISDLHYRAVAGLTEWDASRIVEAADWLHPTLGPLPAGRLTITHAVAPELTTSAWILGMAVHLVGQLLTGSFRESDEEHISTMVSTAIVKGREFGEQWRLP